MILQPLRTLTASKAGVLSVMPIRNLRARFMKGRTTPRAEKNEGHDEGSQNAANQVENEEEAWVALYREYQESVPRLSPAERSRTIASLSSFAVLSTIGKDTGHPNGAVTEFAVLGDGSLAFALSNLSAHKHDLLADPKCSITVMQPGFRDLSQARVTITGSAGRVPDAEVEAVREIYLAKQPGSFWVDFGDFDWFKLDASSIVNVRFNGGFGAAGTVTPEGYRTAETDPIAAFSGPVCGHMNQDHGDATVAMVKHFASVDVDSAEMLSVDKYGIDVAATKGEDRFTLRLGFPNGPVMDRKGIKEAIVAMTKASAVPEA